jgi:antitoxin (DNA-binding transcriptional repressor) of toxin-antitoxin stability system
MEFANVAEFRQNAAKVFDRVQRSGEIVVLRNGRPIGLLVAADAATIDPLRVAAQRARAQMAVEGLRTAARRRGLDHLTPDEIGALIRKTRKARTRRR